MLGAIGAMELGGDIWSTGAFAYDSPLKDILDGGEYTVEQLLAEDELLQEIRGCNQQLLDALATRETVTQLIQYVIEKPRTAVVERDEWLAKHVAANGDTQHNNNASSKLLEDPDYKRIRLPYMACEVLCCEIPAVLDMLVGEQETPPESATDTEESTPHSSSSLLDVLFHVLHDTPSGELDDYRAGYLDKILTIVSRNRPVQVTAYINTGGSYGRTALIKSLVRHLYSHSIMQIAQQLLLPHRPRPPPPAESGDEIVEAAEEEVVVQCDWASSPEILDMLLQTLMSDGDSLQLSLNASDVLITIIQNSMLSSPILLSLTEPETLQRIVDASTLLREGTVFTRSESALTSAMNVLESLILQLGGYGALGTMTPVEEEQETNIFAEDEEEEEPLKIADLTSLKEYLPVLLKRFVELLLDPVCQTWTSPTQFSRDVPVQMLGSSRLHIVRVVESLVLLGDPEVDEQLMASDCLRICLDMFWQFQFCSMLHQSVANLLVHVLEGQNVRQEMQRYFLGECNLLDRLMNSFHQRRGGGGETPEPALPAQTFRYGYMGHVIIVCQALVHAYSPHDDEDEEDEEQDPNNPPVVTPATTTETDDGNDQNNNNDEDESPDIAHATPIVASSSNDGDDMDTSVLPTDDFGEPLILFDLVCNHPLADRWHDFCETTLSTETAIQSIALGGFPVHHRPGLVDEGTMMGDDGDGPPAPPRGGGVLGVLANMDETDMDNIAASMMEVLNAVGTTDDGSQNSGSSGESVLSAQQRQAYAFDDPLGKAGSLGIELGRLTQYQLNENAVETSVGEKEEDSHSSSSDEEQGTAEASGEVPVMDLFTGNFDYSAPAADDFADFADFGSAAMSAGGGIDTDDDFGPFAEGSAPRPPDPFAEVVTNKVNIEDIFGEGDHADLLLEMPDDAFVEVLEPNVSATAADAKDVFESGESIAAMVGTRAPSTENLAEELSNLVIEDNTSPTPTPDDEQVRLEVPVDAVEQVRLEQLPPIDAVVKEEGTAQDVNPADIEPEKPTEEAMTDDKMNNTVDKESSSSEDNGEQRSQSGDDD